MSKHFEIGKKYRLVDVNKGTGNLIAYHKAGVIFPKDKVVLCTDIYQGIAITNTKGVVSFTGLKAEDIKGLLYDGMIIGDNEDLNLGAFEEVVNG